MSLIPDSPNPLDGDRFECPPGMLKGGDRIEATPDMAALPIRLNSEDGTAMPPKTAAWLTMKAVETSTDRLNRAVAMIEVLTQQVHEQRTHVRLLGERVRSLEAQIMAGQADS